MILSVLVTALECRDWKKVHSELHRQARLIGGNRVEVLYELDGGQLPSGVKRQRLADRSRGEYLAFVDDDDVVSPDYCECLADALEESRPQVLTFDTRVISLMGDSSVRAEVWSFGPWANDRGSGRMTYNHLCAWRRDVASKVAWCPDLGYADDQLWYQPLHHSGLVRDRRHVDRVLYYYLYNSGGTSNQSPERRHFARVYFGSGIRCFQRGTEILVEVGGDRNLVPDGWVRVRDRHNSVLTVRLDSLNHYHTVRLQ